MRQAPGRCVDLSASGARVEARDGMEVRTLVLVTSEQFGRMGNATIRYCRREGMKHILGLQFSTAFGLSDPARKKILDKVLQKDRGIPADKAAQKEKASAQEPETLAGDAGTKTEPGNV